MSKAKAYHPDRNYHLPDEQRKQASLMFNKYNKAYTTLIDPVTRACHDLQTQDYIDDGAYQRIVELKKAETEKLLPLMEAAFCHKRECEASRSRGGLLIVSAQYGSFEPDGEVIDVTVPVQCMVDNSRIILQKDASYSWEQGFYDPCPFVDKQLYIQYLFLGEEHEVVFEDGAPPEVILCPLETHSLAYQRAMRSMRREQALMRKVVVISGVATAMMGYWMVYPNLWAGIGGFVNKCRKKVFSWTTILWPFRKRKAVVG